MYIVSNTVQDYSIARSIYGAGSASDLGTYAGMGPHIEGRTFGDALIARINARHPTMYTYFAPVKDPNVTASHFAQDWWRTSDFDFFCGHGGLTEDGTRTFIMTYDWAITLSPSHNYLIPNPPPSSSPPSYGPGGFGNPFNKWVILNSCKTLYNENAQDYLGSFNGCHTILGHHAIMYMSNESECRWKYWLFGWRCGEWYPQRDTKNTWNLFANYWVDGHIDNPNTYYGLWDCYNLAIRDQIYTHDRFGVSPAIVWIWGYLPNTNQYGNGRNEHFTANGSEYQWPITSNSNFSYMGINYYRVAYGSPSY